MKQAHRWPGILLLALGALSMLSSCTIWPNDPPGAVGRITAVIGPHAMLNGGPARRNDYLMPGDKVATGPSSFIEVRFRQGGVMQLDQNTDPSLEEQWDKVKSGTCQLVRVLFGRVFFNASNLCIADPNLSGIARSQIVLRSGMARSDLVVLYGNFEMHSRGGVVVNAGQGIMAERGSSGQPRPLSNHELDDAVRWRAAFFGGDVRAVVPDRGGADNAAAPPATPADPATVGYCCLGREVFGSRNSTCVQRNGRFFPRKEDAQRACRP